MKWIDARVKQPPSNSFDRFPVLFLYEGSVMHGFAGWVPDEGYKSGKWGDTETTNGNKLQGTVLYWHGKLGWPSDVVINTISKS